MIYDTTPNAKNFINEPFVVKLKGGMPDANQDLSCMYTGLDPDSLDNLYIVVFASRTGTMERHKEKKDEKKKGVTGEAALLRRPEGCGVYSVRKIREETDDGTTKECPVALMKSDEDMFYQLHEYIIMDQQTKYQPLDKGRGVNFECTLLRGSVAQVKRDNPLLFQGSTVHSVKKGFPDVMVPGEERNDLCVSPHRPLFCVVVHVRAHVCVFCNRGKCYRRARVCYPLSLCKGLSISTPGCGRA